MHICLIINNIKNISMKKITDNTFWGKLTLILNVLLLVFFILSMIFLMRFDKTNKAVVYERAAYDKTYENFIMAQHPLKQDSAEVAYYQYKLDTLKLKTAAPRREEDLGRRYRGDQEHPFRKAETHGHPSGRVG